MTKMTISRDIFASQGVARDSFGKRGQIRRIGKDTTVLRGYKMSLYHISYENLVLVYHYDVISDYFSYDK